ncbi:MAG TPA: hypothetical protein VK395_35515 [Gemmataceae bacterium]|nr:hypothetical protein [Gemmataceae bacterium]
MIDAKTQELLENILRRVGRSLLQYVSEAFPWTTAEEQDALAQFQVLAREEGEAAAAIAKFLDQQGYGVPYLGPFPMAFTTINYVSLDYLLPLLVETQRQDLEQMQRALAQVTDAQAREQILKIIDMSRRHLTTLKALAASHPQVASTVH